MPPQSTLDDTDGSNDVQKGRRISDVGLSVGKMLASPPKGEEVVITGLAGQYPDSDNVYHFRDNLFNKVDMVTDDSRRWEHTHPEIPRRSGKINNISKFDPGFFGLHHRHAHSMCPMVRLHLQSAVECIMDAGLHPSDLEGANCGVFVGTCFSETERTWYFERLESQNNCITGCERSMVANRVSYYLKLKGPSFVCDTACSSSLYALQIAYRMLRMGEIDCAIVGGTNLCLHPYVSLQFARLGVLSMDGTCKCFDAEGSGYARSEGICSIFLQKSKDAIRVYGQVVHAKINCDGYKPEGITYPSGEMQRRLLTEIYDECGVNPADLVFLEAHGTGTRVGDPEECVAIDEVFCKNRKSPLMIGSVKSNIGHSESASGLCSLTKAIIALETGYIPPNLHFKKPREGVEPLERGTLKVITDKTPFENQNGLVGVNSFGFGGSNCHVLLRWNEKKKSDLATPDDLPRLVCVSGRTEPAVFSLLDSVIENSVDAEYIRLFHNIFRKHIPSHQFRGYSIVSKQGEIKRSAHYFSENQEDLYVIFDQNDYRTFGTDLLTIPVFADVIKKIQEIFAKHKVDVNGGLFNNNKGSISNHIMGPVAVQIGIIAILNEIGVKPTAVIGDSLGELVCAYYDSVLSLEELVLSIVAIQNVLNQVLQPLARYNVKITEDQLRKVMPTTIEISGVITKQEVVICGPEKVTDSFMKTLKNNGVTVEHISTSLSFMKKDAEKMRSQLSKKLKALVSSPGKKSTKWLTHSNNVPMIDYLTESLFGPSRFSNLIKEIPPRSVVFEVGPGSFIQSIRKHLAARKISTLSLDEHKDENKVVTLLDTLGGLHNHGYNFDLSKIYPEVQFPVSRGTRMVSPYIKWKHDDDWFVFSYKSETTTKTGARVLGVAPTSNDWKFIQGHVVDGRLLFPAAGYLIVVWETLALINNSMTNDMAVTFENVKFKRATHIRDEIIEFIVMIQRGTGNFEVIESGSGIVTGRIFLIEKDPYVDLPCDIPNDESMKMKAKDVYKNLRIRGYNYRGNFRGITEANVEATRGLVKWDGNWVTFIDNMFQMKLLNYDTRLLYVPTGIDSLTVDGSKHITYATGFGEDPQIPVYVFPECGIIKSGGIEVRGLKASSIPRRKAKGEPVLEKYVFVPNDMNADVELSVRINMQICLENIMSVRVKGVEVIDECTREDSEPLASHIVAALGDLPLIQPAMKLLTKQEIKIPNVTVENGKLNTESECLLVVGSEFLKRPQMLHVAFGSLKENRGFVISREDPTFDPSTVDSQGVTILTVHRNDKETIVLMTKAVEYQTPLAVDVTDSAYEFAWVPALQDIMKEEASVVVYAQNEPLSGVLGLVNCLRREQGGNKVRSVFIVDPEAPKFDLGSPFYVDQLKKNAAVNVFKDGKWGTYRHVLLEKLDEIENEHCFVNATTRGDLSSLRWISGPLTPNTELRDERKLVHVYNSALNFKDIMTASGRINADAITTDRMEQECLEGFEFSGRTTDGKRVMGIAISRALSNLVAADTNLLFNVPDMWTLQEAATVPVVYTTVMVSLFEAGKMKGGESILIHSGAGGVGQAAINIALFYGCKVYTTCGSDEKRAFLKETFPQLTDNCIGNSHDTSFVQMILNETKGRGVDLVLNSLAEEKLMASVRCLAHGGRFVEIGKFDFARDTSFRVALLERECSFHSVMLEMAISSSLGVKRRLQAMLQRGIDSGAVKPLNSHVFKRNEVEQAFRFMASGKHMGKVIINLREEESDKKAVPTAMLMKGLPRYLCSEESTHVICGGLGGFGLELADWLIMRGARKLVLTSRSGVQNGYQASRIRLWISYGVTIRISTSDITTLSGCEQMLRQAELLGSVEAIFNLAVVLKDGLFTNQTVEAFHESFGPKAKATKHLDRASRKLCPKLRDFVIFSSVSCGRGNPGQTNYGMANSVMERICEKRKQEGLPALAIEWGAIGEVGLVAEMQEEHTDLEIGGTLQQRISSCLQVMDNFLKQNNPVVGSMVVAEKRAGIAGADNVVDAVANILGLTDLKTVSLHSSLAELGMDSMTAVEIKQSLEREFDVYLTSQDIRSMTFARLYEIEAERDSAAKKGTKVERLPGGLELIVRLMGDESSANIPVIRLPSKLEEGKPGPKVLLLPGIEGAANVLNSLAENLHCHALCVQYCHDIPEDTITETSQNLLPHFESLLSPNEPFTIVAYSFGSVVALEVVALLEQKGYKGTLILIDGSPKMLLELVKQQAITESEDQFQTSLIGIVMSIIMPFEIVMENRDKIFRANGFEERIKVCQACAPVDSPYSPEYQRSTAIGLYRRVKGLVKYAPSFARIESTVKLIRPSQASILDIAQDYHLSEICGKPVQVATFDGNHVTILKNTELAEFINGEATGLIKPDVVEPEAINGQIFNGDGDNANTINAEAAAEPTFIKQQLVQIETVKLPMPHANARQS